MPKIDQNTIAEEGEEDRINWTTSEEKLRIYKLVASNDVQSSGKKSDLLVVLGNEGSLTVKRKRCSLWLVLSDFMCASSYILLQHLLLRKELRSGEVSSVNNCVQTTSSGKN